jgi:hypothetical protein
MNTWQRSNREKPQEPENRVFPRFPRTELTLEGSTPSNGEQGK